MTWNHDTQLPLLPGLGFSRSRTQSYRCGDLTHGCLPSFEVFRGHLIGSELRMSSSGQKLRHSPYCLRTSPYPLFSRFGRLLHLMKIPCGRSGRTRNCTPLLTNTYSDSPIPNQTATGLFIKGSLSICGPPIRVHIMAGPSL